MSKQFTDHGDFENACQSSFDDWIENQNGNFVLRDDNNEILCTVYHTVFDFWQIAIDGDHGSRFVADERFNTSNQAIVRAQAILNGAKCTFSNGTHRNSATNWAKQARVTNGKTTYGRKCNGLSVTVKCAKSGKWFYMTYQGATCNEPQGWFASAQEAMAAFDSRA